MAKKKAKQLPQDNECTIPGPVNPEIINRASFGKITHEQEDVIRYVECETHDEKVQFLEKMKSERLFGDKMDAWDVHTDKNRWWVITNPTNLYSQEQFPSLDYTMTFHVGLIYRVMAKNRRQVERDHPDRLAASWRRWEQAAKALDGADEAEEFQAVGMRCRECLLSITRSLAADAIVPTGQERPKAGDFIHWSELIANSLAHGSSAEEVRGYLKSVMKATWQLVNWLTHASNATRFDGDLAIEATEYVLVALGAILIRQERGIPDRCPKCSSYLIESVYHYDEEVYITTCASCGWVDIPEETVSDDEN